MLIGTLNNCSGATITSCPITFHWEVLFVIEVDSQPSCVGPTIFLLGSCRNSGRFIVYCLSLSFSLASVRNTSRSEEHTSELQSRFDLVCRLLLDKKIL